MKWLIGVLAIMLILFAGLADAQSITVDASTHFQTIAGFGASDAFRNPLNADQLKLLFDPTNGIGLTFLRVGMNYTGNIMDHGSGASPTDGNWADAQAAQAYGAKVWATPWTPPAAYKTNNSIDNGGNLCDGTNGCGDHRADWANLMVQFLQNAANNGVSVYAISMQNEPDQSQAYVSCLYSPSQMLKFVAVAGPIIKVAFPNVKLMIPEWSGWGGLSQSTSLFEAIPSINQYIGIYGTHQYDDQALPSSSVRPVWETEYSTFDAFDASINNGIAMAQQIDEALTTANAAAWHWWWGFGKEGDNEGLIGVDTNFYTLTIPKRFYVLGNFSKFIRPGYIRVGTSGGIANVQFEAYVNPANNNPVIVAINTNGSPQTLTTSLTGGAKAASMIPYITDASRNIAQQASVPVSGGGFSYSLPASSVTTLVASGAVAPTPAPSVTATGVPFSNANSGRL